MIDLFKKLFRKSKEEVKKEMKAKIKSGVLYHDDPSFLYNIFLDNGASSYPKPDEVYTFFFIRTLSLL